MLHTPENQFSIKQYIVENLLQPRYMAKLPTHNLANWVATSLDHAKLKLDHNIQFHDSARLAIVQKAKEKSQYHFSEVDWDKNLSVYLPRSIHAQYDSLLAWCGGVETSDELSHRISEWLQQDMPPDTSKAPMSDILRLVDRVSAALSSGSTKVPAPKSVPSQVV